MTDATGARPPDVDPLAGHGASPDIDWGAVESDDDDDEARALIAQASAEEEPQLSLESGEIAQTPEEQAQAAEREKKKKEEEEVKRKEEGERKKEEIRKMSEERERRRREEEGRVAAGSDWERGATKWQKKKKKNKDKTRYTCEICNVETIGEKARDSHQRGKNHMTKTRQAALRGQNEELNRHGAEIAEQQGRRKSTPETDPESTFDRPGRPNGHMREPAREPPRDHDRRHVGHWDDDRNPTRGDVDDPMHREDEGQQSRFAYYRRSTDPRPRYFDAMVTPDPKPESPRLSDGRLPDVDADDSNPEFRRHEPSPTGATDAGHAGESGVADNDSAIGQGYTPTYVVPASRPAPDAGRPRLERPVVPDTSERPVIPDTSHSVGAKPVDRDAGPSSGMRAGSSAIAKGKSPFLPTRPRKSAAKAPVTDPSEGKRPAAADAFAAVKEGKRPIADSGAGSSSQGGRPAVGNMDAGSSLAGKTSGVDDKAGSAQESNKPVEDIRRRVAEGNVPAADVRAVSAGAGKLPVDARVEKGGDGKRPCSSERDGASRDRKSSENDERHDSRERMKSVPDDRASGSGDKRRAESDGRVRGYAERRGSAETRVGSSKDGGGLAVEDKLGSAREERRSPPYDRGSSRGDRRSPYAAQVREDRERRSRSYDRRGSRDDRTSPPYDPAAVREDRDRRSIPYDRTGSREDSRTPPFDRSALRDDRRSPPFDRSSSREQRRLSPDDREPAREGRRSPSYDRADPRDGRRPSPDDRAGSPGDRKRSRGDTRADGYGEGRRPASDSRPSDPGDGRRAPRDDRDRRGDERRNATDYRGNSADWDKRSAAELGTAASREKYLAGKDRQARDSPPAPYQREAPPPPPSLKLRSQAVPSRPEDDAALRDRRKRRFTDPRRDDTSRGKSPPAPNDGRFRSSLPCDSQRQYEIVNDGSQRRKLLESPESESRRLESPRDRADDGIHRKDGSRDETGRRSGAGERSMPRDSERFGNGDHHRRHSAGSSHPDRGNGELQRRSASAPSALVAPSRSPDTFNPEDYPVVPEEFLNESMSVAEWRELRHFILNEGSDVDKLAYKMMQEIILSPVLGINDTSLAPFSRAMMASVKKQYFTPRGVFAKLSDFPEGLLRLDPKYNSEAKEDEEWARHQTPEYLALCQVRDNIEFTFNTNEHPSAKKDNKGAAGGRADFPTRGSFGIKNQRKGPGVVNDGERPPRYEDSVAEDPLFKQIMDYLSAREIHELLHRS